MDAKQPQTAPVIADNQDIASSWPFSHIRSARSDLSIASAMRPRRSSGIELDCANAIEARLGREEDPAEQDNEEIGEAQACRRQPRHLKGRDESATVVCSCATTP